MVFTLLVAVQLGTTKDNCPGSFLRLPPIVRFNAYFLLAFDGSFMESVKRRASRSFDEYRLIFQNKYL